MSLLPTKSGTSVGPGEEVEMGSALGPNSLIVGL